jgi:hypothetical protein
MSSKDAILYKTESLREVKVGLWRTESNCGGRRRWRGSLQKIWMLVTWPKKQNSKDEPSPEKDTSGRRIRPNHL